MVHNHQKNPFNGSGIRLAEAGLLDAQIVTLKADNWFLCAVTSTTRCFSVLTMQER
jgi:hypothetical protein